MLRSSRPLRTAAGSAKVWRSRAPASSSLARRAAPAASRRRRARASARARRRRDATQERCGGRTRRRRCRTARRAYHRAVRRPPVGTAAIAAGSPSTCAAVPAPAAGQATVPGELRAAAARGAHRPERHDGWRAAWDDAVRTHRRLGGARRARSARCCPTPARSAARRPAHTDARLGAVPHGAAQPRVVGGAAAAAPGARMTFPGSELVWQHYPGQGLQLQWLATFGRANALFTGRATTRACARCSTRPCRSPPSAPAVSRGSTLFRFDGGRPPWVSAPGAGHGRPGARARGRPPRRPRYFEAARAALGIFRAPPPEGVRVRTAAGAHYLIYSFAPRLRVLNGFVQSLNGLLDFARLANDAERRRAVRRRRGAAAPPSCPATTPAPGRATR